MTRHILAVLLGLLAGVWEVAVWPFLPPFASIRPLLPLAVLTLIASGRSRALVTAASAGLLLDLYSVGTFDLATLRWVGLVLLLDVLARHFLTNRSIYSALALVFIGRLVERASAWLFGELSFRLGRSVYEPHIWGSLGSMLLWDLGLVAIGFVLLAFFTRRFVTFVPHRTASANWYEER